MGAFSMIVKTDCETSSFIYSDAAYTVVVSLPPQLKSCNTNLGLEAAPLGDGGDPGLGGGQTLLPRHVKHGQQQRAARSQLQARYLGEMLFPAIFIL